MKDTNSWFSLFMVSFDLLWPQMTSSKNFLMIVTLISPRPPQDVDVVVIHVPEFSKIDVLVRRVVPLPHLVPHALDRKSAVLAGPSPENIRLWSPDFTPISPFHPFIRRSKFWPHLNPFDLCFSVPDDYNQIEEKDEKKNFVNSLWADSANNPVMSSKLICVFQTENQQSKSEVKSIWSLFV